MQNVSSTISLALPLPLQARLCDFIRIPQLCRNLSTIESRPAILWEVVNGKDFVQIRVELGERYRGVRCPKIDRNPEVGRVHIMVN